MKDKNPKKIKPRDESPIAEIKQVDGKKAIVKVETSSNENNSRPTWDEYFLEMAKLIASRSRDSSKVGAVLVGIDKEVLATGYNGFPRLVEDLEKRQGKEEKLNWAVHAEVNAICNAARVGVSLKSSTLYVNKFPCSNCAGALVQVGITKVVSNDTKLWKNNPAGDDGSRALRIFAEAGIIISAPDIELQPINNTKK